MANHRKINKNVLAAFLGVLATVLVALATLFAPLVAKIDISCVPNSTAVDNNNDNITFTHEFGKIELTDAHSGMAYIYKDFLDATPIGATNNDGLTSNGWYIRLFKGTESFELFIYSDTSITPPINCTVQYNIMGNYQFSSSKGVELFYNNTGDLQIEFNCNYIPFDLRESDAIDVCNIYKA